MAASPHVIEVTDATFVQDVVERSREVPVVVDFWAPWCGPCRALGPVLEQLAGEGGGAWILAKINTDQNPQVAQQLGIRGIPAVKAIVDGQLVDEFTGAQPAEFIKQWLARLVPDHAGDLIEHAREALRIGEYSTAEAIFTNILAEEPGQLEAVLGLARVALATGEGDRALEILSAINESTRAEHADLIEGIELLASVEGDADEAALRARIETDPLDYEARHALGLLLAARGDLDAGLEELLEIVTRDREWGDDAARKSMVKLFNVIGLNEELTRVWQKRLGRAMY